MLKLHVCICWVVTSIQGKSFFGTEYRSASIKGAASCQRTFCRAIARGSYLKNSCSKCQAAVEALARIVYKPTKSTSSIKPMKLANREVMPFQAIKLTCASESEVQTLKATVSQHEEDSNRELFPVPC